MFTAPNRYAFGQPAHGLAAVLAMNLLVPSLTWAQPAPPRALPVTDAPSPKPAKPATATIPATATAKPAPAKPAVEPEPQPTGLLTWRAVSEMPALPGVNKATGLAGSFVGALDANHAITAGGTYYPDKGPLEGGQKHWSDAIMILKRQPGPQGAEPTYTWSPATTRMPKALSNGCSVAIDGGVLCLGGIDSQECTSDVFSLTWNGTSQSVEVTPYPPLPKATAYAGAARVGDLVIIAGGVQRPGGTAVTEAYALDLTKKSDPTAFTWQPLAPLPRATALPVCLGAPKNDLTNSTAAFYLMSGRGTDGPLTNGLCYNPEAKSWSDVPTITSGEKKHPTSVLAGTGVTLDNGRLLVIGGDDAEIARLLEVNARPRASDEEMKAYQKFNQALVAAHPGYRREMLSYDSTTQEWKNEGVFPTGTPAATPAFLWDGAVFLIAGEASPGRRTTKVWRGNFISR